MRRFAIFAVACVMLSACATPATAPGTSAASGVVVGSYSKAEARRDLAALQTGHAIALQLAIAYVRQPACGTAAAPSPPLCATYPIGLRIKKADDVFSAAVASAETAIETSDGTALRLSVNAASAALEAYRAAIPRK